jgi:DNA mismatch repair ATPase MutS
MSDKKKWESMEQFQVEIDQWRARAELAEARVTELEERSRKDALDGQTTLDVLNNELTKAEARVTELEAKNAEWEQKARNWMATPEAAKRLDGYREMTERVAVLEELLSEAICYDWEPECPPKELMERIDKALAGRKEGR